MDIQAIIDQIVGALREAPEKAQEIIADPAAAIENITGHQIEGEDMAAVVQGVLAKIGEEGGELQEKLACFGDMLGEKVSSLMGEGGAFGDLLNNIFGKKDE
ncbi:MULTISPECIES: hypothetical protein [Gordonibacter]|uniref:Homocitrate synthase n=1 Tax=Gordonibacter faecis TaxID=3047475 RepID=A0ABT7DS24_9ACTN|nr:MULTISPECIES: hypothetical protein [unclassified Gordonibacter]MDJ1651393.1 hypothetical protein [Gordonibacter sp. KGMB12511]HIW75325.1 hypothetical protein [Candidatus Gordonibacter avicola]